MRSIQERAQEAHQHLTQRLEEEKQAYLNSNSEEYKQDYWDKKICGLWWHSDTGDFPINLAAFKTKNADLEANFDRFIPWVMLALEELWFSWTIDDIFILDESAKHYLKINAVTSNNQHKALWILSNQEEQFPELAEKIWDLFYDALAEVLIGISETAPDIAAYMKQAWENAQNAWEICRPYINEKTNPKHKTDIAGMSNKELWNRIGKLDNKTLKYFLKLLWDKIRKDWLADEWRWRKKLATELFETSKSILSAQLSVSD